MNAKQRFQAVMNREPVDRLPIDIWMTGEVRQSLLDYAGVADDYALYEKLGIDKIVWVGPTYTYNPTAEEDAAAGIYRASFGQPARAKQSGNAVYLEATGFPLLGYDTVESLDKYPYWPDPDKFEYVQSAAACRSVSNKYATLGPWVSFFEIYSGMRGMEQAMMDIIDDPDYVQEVLDRIEHIQTEMMKRYFAQVGDTLDMIFVSDDMGSQSSLLISPRQWDMLLKDRMHRWCSMIHDAGYKVFYHTDGAAEALIPRLIDAGIDVLNPIQHICPGMEMDQLKAKYGDRLIFHGGVDNQGALPFGSVDDVVAETMNCLTNLGAGKQGYLPCSCHNIQAGTPVQNIIAMIETVKTRSSEL